MGEKFKKKINSSRSIVRLPRQLWRSEPAPIMEGPGPEVEGRPSIEPSHGGGERWACRPPIEPAGAFDSQSQCCCMVPHMAERDFIVLMLNCARQKVDKVIIVFRSVQVARRLTDFSIPVLTGFQKAALPNRLHAVTFKTLSTLNPCWFFFFSDPDLNTAWIVSLRRPRRNSYTLQDYFWTPF